MTAKPIAAVLAAAVLLTGCGGEPGPATAKDVARAYVTAAFLCGEQGAGATYDLSWSPQRDWTRTTYLRLERRQGCSPQPVPRLHLVQAGEAGDEATVWVYPADPRVKPDVPRLVLVLERIDGAWKVNTLRSDDPELLTA